jgi:hypothetical protein
VALTTHFHQVPRQKKDCVYTHAPPPRLHGLSRVNFTFTGIKHNVLHSKDQQLLLSREARSNSYLTLTLLTREYGELLPMIENGRWDLILRLKG